MSVRELARPLSVSELTALVRDAIAVEPRLEDVLVEGEISNLRNPGSGHLYFNLRDRDASLRCVCFRMQAARLRFAPQGGMHVLARGRVDVYSQDGAYQLYVDSLDPVGVGAIALAVEQLRRRLGAEGLLDESRRRPLPLLPRRIAVVTSSTGAAVRDVCTVLRRRAPSVGVVVVPTPVQGDGAEAAVVRALKRAAELPAVEVVLLVRGGGSFEDLVAFQAELVARAIVACPIPVITGIGHETDTTIADLVADRRAPTPSAAAELAVPDLAALGDEIVARHARLGAALRERIGRRRVELRSRAERLRLQSPVLRLPQLRQQLDARLVGLRSVLLIEAARRRRAVDALTARLRLASPHRRLELERLSLTRRRVHLDAAARSALTHRRGALATASGRLQALSPLRVLQRGYSITLDARGRALTTAAGVSGGALLRTRLAEGELRSRVTEAGE